MKVKSILDTDLYLFSVSYYFIKQYPDASGTLAFNDRNKTEYTEEDLGRLKSELFDLTSLELKKEEMEWCKKNIPYIPEIYWEWLKGFRFEYDRINLWLDSEKHLHIEVTDKLYKTALYEIPILATVSGIMHEPELVGVNHSEVLGRLAKKVEMINTFGLKVGDMGCRRRASYEIQEEVVEYMAKNIQPELFTGTSNVYLAKKFGVKPLGTMSHFMVMFNMAHHGYRMGNYYTMETWVDTYHGDLGIYLTDTVGSEAFFKNFSKKHAKLFDGIRQDSGDEYRFVDRAVERYKELGINPLTKTIVFSNALTVEKYKDIAEYCKGKIMCSAGIGTSLTCDVPGVKPCNIVMKLKECRMNDNQTMIPCIKLSDDLGKHTGDIEEVRRAKETLGIA